jgi:hypothetical protein
LPQNSEEIYRNFFTGGGQVSTAKITNKGTIEGPFVKNIQREFNTHNKETK